MEPPRGSSAGSMSGAADSSSLPPISARHPSDKTQRPPSKQFVRSVSANANIPGIFDVELLPESDAIQSEAVEPVSSGESLSVLQQEKMQNFATSPDLELLCRENGLSASQFARTSESVTSLDMFLGFWTSMKSVMYFPALKELSVINQPTICELEGVNYCINLEKLCITECGLTQIENLTNCTKLKELNLSSNKIRKLENLDALVNLEKLWINQNELERLDGLWKLTKLTHLWACRNRIDRIDTALNCCVNLTDLNLADNKLSSFKGLLSLTNLDRLAVLILSDPHFGDNPVCRLCNFQTYLMCQLPRLRFLDTVELSARNKQIAEATMIKKKMYYNMRIKAIKRDVHSRIRHAETVRNQAEHHMETSVSALVRHKKEIERFLNENSSRKNDAVKVSQDMLEKLEKKLESVNSCLRDRYTTVYCMNQDFDRLRTSVRCTSEMNIARLMLELETGGNIRLEDGKPSDAWFGSCVELVRSRLFLPDLKKFGINDIQINRVTRIDNRFLRNRFQARMEEVLVTPDKKVKDNVSKKGVTIPNNDVDTERDSEKSSDSSQQEQSNRPQSQCPESTLETSMEYLFYTQSTHLEGQQLRSPADTEQLFIAENGFRGFSGLGTTDFGAAIKLSNSIALLDAPRVTATLIAKGQQVQSNGDVQPSQKSANPLSLTQDMKRAQQLIASGDWDFPSGFLLVAKVFPGYTRCISNADVALAKTSSGSGLGKAQDFTGVQSLQVMHGGAAAIVARGELSANKQKLYYVFDSALVLPEYFVKYQYVLDNHVLGSSRGNSASPDSLRPTISPRTVHCNDEDAVNLGVAAKQVDDFERRYRIRRSQTPQPPENSVYSSTDESIVQLIQMEPLLPGSGASSDTIVPVISSRLQLAASSHIKYLSLLGCELEAIPDMSSLNNHLEVLVLSYNKIQGTNNLERLPKLRVLDLSFNHITSLGYLENLCSLETLEITHNLIRSFDNVERIGKALGKCALKQLDLRKNVICDSKRYRFHVLQHLPKLAQLDQQTVSKEEILIAQRLITKLSPSKVWALHCQKTRCTVPLSASEAAKIDSPDLHPESDDEGDTNLLSMKAEWSSVEELVLNHELLGSIEGLNKAINLRVASFSDNAIERIDGLQACTRLEELCLDDNEITNIENLEQLCFLKKLHLGRNHLTTIQHLDALENLIQLSLEENQISSLRGLGSALKLMELYLGNNEIENLKEIQHLKSLPKLTILDLSGNEITRLPDYRLYSVYYLRRVKVLDGVSVSTQDQSNAKQKYSGKLTFEFILDKCGNGGSVTPTDSAGENQFGRILDMDLSSCRIREIGRIPGNVFSNVREVNLENNQINDISGLEALPKLRILNLNRNKIEKLMPSSLSSDYTMPDSCDGGGKGILACLDLEQLHLAYNQITDMTTLGLQFLDSLKVLHLQGNAIVYFAGLDCNTELVDIRLDKNRIRQLDPHSTLALRQLKFLNLEDNGLKSLSNFNNMLSLETLELSNNRLTDLEEVERLAALPSMIDLRMINNPLTKKHLYRQHVLYKLNSLKVLDGKDVHSDEKERIDMLFLHERAAAAASGTPSAAPERQFVLSPSSIPSKSSASISQVPGIPHSEVLTGSVLRKTTPPPTFPPPDHEADLSITIGSSNTTTRPLLAPTHRNLGSFGNQSNWQVGTNNSGSSSATATVASALSANLGKSVGSEGLYVGSSLRRRLSSVHYDQQQSGSPSLQVNGKIGGVPDTKLPVGIISSQAVVRGPAVAIRRAGFNMQPSSTESPPRSTTQPSDHGLPASLIPSASDAGRSFSGYVVTFGNQKRVSSNYPGPQQETTIPYLSTKLQQQVRRSSERQR